MEINGIANAISKVKLTSIRAVCADPHMTTDVPQINAATGPPIFHISHSNNANAMSDGSTNDLRGRGPCSCAGRHRPDCAAGR